MVPYITVNGALLPRVFGYCCFLCYKWRLQSFFANSRKERTIDSHNHLDWLTITENSFS